MKKHFYLIITLFLFIQCSNKKTNIDCENSVSINETEICIPIEIKGITNVTNNKKYLERVK